MSPVNIRKLVPLCLFFFLQGCHPAVRLSHPQSAGSSGAQGSADPGTVLASPDAHAVAGAQRNVRIIRPLDREIIDFKKKSLSIRLMADAAAFVSYSVVDGGGTALQRGNTLLKAGETAMTINFNQAVTSHRGGFLTLKVGNDAVQFGLGLLFLAAGQSNSVNSECGQCEGYTIPPDPNVLQLNDPGAVNQIYKGMNVPFPFNIESRMKRGMISFDPLPENRQKTPGGAKNVWIRVGKALSDALRMPVGFIMAGIPSTSIEDWTSTLYPRLDYGKYLSLTGVLWHQGESDAIEKTPTAEYLERLKTLVSGTMAGVAAPWVISRASSCREAGTVRNAEAAIETAQNLFIRQGGMKYRVYPGPNTNRIDHPCHFETREQYEAYVAAWVDNLMRSGVIHGTAPRQEFFAYAADISGPLSGPSIGYKLQSGAEHLGMTGAIYVAAITSRDPFTMFFQDSNRVWRKDDGNGAPRAYYTGSIPGGFEERAILNSDLVSSPGTEIYIGYGIGPDPYLEMMSAQRYNHIRTLTAN